MGQPDAEARRAAMIDRQLRDRGIRDERVLATMASVPREAFVPAELQHLAYADEALPIAGGQTISQPYMVARMTELLRTRPGDKVLEIGTGSGYQAAVLVSLGCRVISIERRPELARTAGSTLEKLGIGAEQVEIRVGDGSLGAPEDAPYRGIVVTAAAPRVPEPLRQQLADGGRLVVPVGPRDRQDLLVVTRHGDQFEVQSDGPCVFVPLLGEAGFREHERGEAADLV